MIPFLASHMFQNQLGSVRIGSSDETTQNKKEYLTKLKFKPMLIKVKGNYSGVSEWKEQLINVSMIREVRQGWKEVCGLEKDMWCDVGFIDGNSLYVESTLTDMLSKIWDIQDREINVVTRERRTGRGPF